MKTGGEILLAVRSAHSGMGRALTYVNFGTYSGENWSSQPYQEYGNNRLTWTANVDGKSSTLKLTEANTGTLSPYDGNYDGNYSRNLQLSDYSGDAFQQIYTHKQATNGDAKSTKEYEKFTFNGLRGTPNLSTDDFKLSIESSNSASVKYYSKTETMSEISASASGVINLTDSANRYILKASTSYTELNKYANDGTMLSAKSSENATGYFESKQSGFSISVNLNFSADQLTGDGLLLIKNAKLVNPNFQIENKVVHATTDEMNNINFGLTGDISNVESSVVNDFLSIMLRDDNNIKITSFAGAVVDAGAGNDVVVGFSGNDVISGGMGNDSINGGSGNDTLSSGGGKDSLTGSKGNDNFILSKSDYDFTSAKTVLADTITDFKYVKNGEQDTLTLDGFGSIAAFKTLADAKKAGSTANVIIESGSGKLWYNEDGDSALVGALNFATVKGLSNDYLVQAGWLSL